MFRFMTCKTFATGIVLATALITTASNVAHAWPEAAGGVDPRTGKPVRGVRLLEGAGKPTPKTPVKKPEQKRPTSWDVF